MSEALTSVHGRRLGIDSSKNLVMDGKIVVAAGTTGAKNGTTVAVEERGNGILNQTILTCTATPITFTDDPGVAQYGGVKVYDFPAGLIVTMGAVIDGSLTLTEAAWTDTFDGDVSLGTVTATTGNTLVSTEADIMISNAMTQAVGQVANCDAVSSATQVTESAALWADGTTTAKDCYLNFLIDDAAAHTDQDGGTFTGTITITWMNLGDN